MEKSLLREEDVRLSNNVSDILDEKLYVDCQNVERVYDKARQVQGIDVIFDYNDKHYTCDEKSAVRYKNLQTFSLELSFINRGGQVQEGWLTNPKYTNNSFMFVWLDDDGIKCALVLKQKILDHLKSIGWTVENLRKKADRIRNDNDESYGNIKTNGCKFSFSKQLYEQPINILLPRKTYMDIADAIWKIPLK